MGGLGARCPSQAWSIVLSLNGKPIQFEIDTGAEVTAISQNAHSEIGSPQLRPSDRTLRGPSNNKLPVKGEFTALLGDGKREVEQQLFVVENLHKHLLGRPAIEALDLVVRVGAVIDSMRDPGSRYPSLFQGLGKLEGEYTIQLEEGAEPDSTSVP